MNMPSASDFHIMGRALVVSGRDHLRGSQDYLTLPERRKFAKDLISDIKNPGGRITRSDRWYLQYYREPYMETFSEQQLHARWADIWDNLMVVTPEIKISPNFGKGNEHWIERFTDLIAESQFRGGIRNSISQSTIQDNFADLLDGSLKHIHHEQWRRPYVFKFGQKQHVQSAFDNEKIRFARSGLYNSPEMNRAQKDDENVFEFSVMPTFLKDLNGLVGFSAFDREVLPEGVVLRVEHAAPYLVWCASDRYNPVMPSAFKYDSVLIIKDRQKFQRAVLGSIRKQSLRSQVRFAPVRYLDPYLQMDTSMNIRFSKHFRFSYQHEYRIVIESDNVPEFEFIDVPGLQSFSEVFHLK